ncbi:MAG: hypothetical protein M1338_05875 [Patescibacteria group bacterium]|nr:hypothetical protein [Patescibacteria group bacterium]
MEFSQINNNPQNLSIIFKELIANLKNVEVENRKEQLQEIPTLETNWVTHSASQVYEKIRNAIDYREENVLRRSAIERIINRRTRSKEEPLQLAQHLAQELIQSGYISSQDISSVKISKLTHSIERYFYFSSLDPERGRNYYIALASAEIEDIVAPQKKEKVILETIFRICQDQIQFVSDLDKNHQLYIALNKIFLKYDSPMLIYMLMEKIYPEITIYDVKNPKAEISRQDLSDIFNNINKLLKNNLSRQFTKMVKKYYPVFIFFKDVVSQNPSRYEIVFQQPNKLEAEINYFTEESYIKTKSNLTRGIFRAILFIFLTKMILAFILELPYDVYVIGKINYVPLFINLIFPPLLMFVSASLIKVPGKKNTEKLVSIIKDIVYKGKDETPTKALYSSRSTGLNAILTMFYGLTFVVSFALVIWVLIKLDFNLISSILFFFFLSVVSFFAFRLRQSTRELVVVQEREGWGATIIDFFLLPFLTIGHWISVKFDKVNVFLFIFDFIIEAPFKTVLEVVENWFAFIKEKKDEMMS